MKRYVMISVWLCLVIVGIYANSLFNEPTNWDDPGLWENRTHYVLSQENLINILTIKNTSTYQPLRDISYMLDFALCPAKPVLAIHIHNILLYCVFIIVSWVTIYTLFRAFSVEQQEAFLWASITASLYALHPVHVECVTWLYARKEPLLGIFTMLTVWAFIKARIDNHRYYLASGFFLVMAILSQPTACMVPLILMVIDLCLSHHKSKKISLNTRPMFLVCSLCMVAVFALWFIRMMYRAGGIYEFHGGSFWSNLLAVSQIFIEYLRLYSINVYFAADYPIHLYTSPTQWQAWLYLAVNFVLLCTGLYAFRSGRYLLTIFIAWHYVFVLPVSHIFPITQNLTDRYALLPSLSFCVLLGYAFARMWYWRPRAARFSEDFPALLSAALLLMVVVFYSCVTFQQTFVWRDSFNLWEHTLKKFPQSHVANLNLAVISIDYRDFKCAKTFALNALKIEPLDPLSFSNLALAQTELGEYENAIYNYRIAIELKPDLLPAKVGLARCYGERGDYQKSYELNALLVRDADYTKTIYGQIIYPQIALAAWKIGKKQEAEKFFLLAKSSIRKDIKDQIGLTILATSMNLPYSPQAHL